MEAMAGAGEAAESGEPGERQAALAAAARRRFAALAQRSDGEIDLAEGALLIAAEEYPGLDVGAGQARLDALAARVRRHLAAPEAAAGRRDPDEAALAALHEVLFVEEGFAGADADDYYDPRNSFLNDVLERKRGLPILLAVLYCEGTRRAGLEAVGIGLPGRFIVQFRGAHLSALVDPYDRGARLSPEACAEMVSRIAGQPVSLAPEHFRPAPRKQILARILTNLKLEYLRRGALHKALAAVERILLVSPSIDQVRDRGVILLHLGQQGAAWFDLQLYARLADDAPDVPAIRATAERLWRHLGRHN